MKLELWAAVAAVGWTILGALEGAPLPLLPPALPVANQALKGGGGERCA